MCMLKVCFPLSVSVTSDELCTLYFEDIGVGGVFDSFYFYPLGGKMDANV